ncbi:MAG: DUF6089 family protein [Bacteroidia bacterium]
MKKIITGFFLFALLGQTFAQVKERSNEIGIFLGGSFYIGELNPAPSGFFDGFTKPAGGVLFRHNFSERFALRANLLFGTLEGDDSYSNVLASRDRNLSFKSPVDELSVQWEFNFLPYAIGDKKHTFTPYIFIGLGVFKFNPQASVNGNWVALQPLHTEGQGKAYNLIQPSIPFGVGIKMSFSKTIGLGFEWGMRKTFTGYIDDVHGTYPNFGQLAASHGIMAAALSDRSLSTDPIDDVGRQRGNNTTDWYSFAGVTLTFKLKGKHTSCYSFH